MTSSAKQAGKAVAIWTILTLVPSLTMFRALFTPLPDSPLLEWSSAFIIDSLIIGTIGGVLIHDTTYKLLPRILIGAAIGFLTSLFTCLASCTVVAPDGEERPWFGVALVPVVFFATLAGAITAAWSRKSAALASSE